MSQRPASGHLSLQQKGSIIALHQRNVTSRLTLRRMLDATEIPLQNGLHYRENFDVLRKVASGVPRKTTPNQDAMFLQAVRAKPFTSLQELKGIYFQIRCSR